MIDLSKFSQENLIKIQKVLKFISDEVELRPVTGALVTSVEIPIENFEKEGIDRRNMIYILDIIDNEGKIIPISEMPLFSFGNSEAERITDMARKKLIAEKHISISVLNSEKLKEIKQAVEEKMKNIKREENKKMILFLMKKHVN